MVTAAHQMGGANLSKFPLPTFVTTKFQRP